MFPEYCKIGTTTKLTVTAFDLPDKSAKLTVTFTYSFMLKAYGPFPMSGPAGDQYTATLGPFSVPQLRADEIITVRAKAVDPSGNAATAETKVILSFLCPIG